MSIDTTTLSTDAKRQLLAQLLRPQPQRRRRCEYVIRDGRNKIITALGIYTRAADAKLAAKKICGAYVADAAVI